MLQNCTIGAIVFFVSDLARALSFYRGTLGLPVETVDGHDGPFAMGQVGEVTLVLIAQPAQTGQSPVVVFSLGGGGIDDFAEALVAKGVEIVTPVSESPDGGLSLDFPDPDGNLLSLHQEAGLPRRR
jgi:predicted enzyme related to lactoylglutathione lyase